MRFLTPILISLALFLSITCSVLAMDSTSSGSRIDQRLVVRKLSIEERLNDLKERIASKTATLRLRLQNFKDKQKATRVERVSATLNQINDKETRLLNAHLNKMTDILSKVELRINTASSSANTNSAKATVDGAKIVIQKAKEAVATQSANDYTLSITSEATAGSQAKAMRNKLFNDLKAVRDLVVASRRAVATAINATVKITGGTQ